MRALSLSRGIAALAILALAAGGTLAASPSPSPAESAGSSASPSADTSASPSAAASSVSNSPSLAPAAASEAPVRSDTARESEPVEKDDPADKAETPDSPPSAAEVTDIVGRLKAAGISTTDAAFAALAAKVGVGGAVRTLAFANASGKTPDQIVAMFQGGKGWGQIKHELKLSIGPGIGWIMGGGNGNGHAKGPKSK
jgi:hypothetical protein